MPVGLAPAPRIVWFRGSDAVRFINDLISQEIGSLEPGSTAQSLLLAPNGRIEFLLWVLRGENEVGLVTEDGRDDQLTTLLSRYRIRVDVEIALDTRPTYLIVGDSRSEAMGWSNGDAGLVADISWPTIPRTLLAGGAAPDLPEFDSAAIEAMRIAEGIPLVGVDLDEKTIPQEAGVVAESVSFTKGCFLGQELVARLDARGGRVNRQLRRLEFDEPVPQGTVLTSEGKEVGTVTSASGTSGLALVWREVEPGDRVDAGATGTTVVEIPQKTAGSFTTS